MIVQTVYHHCICWELFAIVIALVLTMRILLGIVRVVRVNVLIVPMLLSVQVVRLQGQMRVTSIMGIV